MHVDVASDVHVLRYFHIHMGTHLPVGQNEGRPVEVQPWPVTPALVGIQVHAATLGRGAHLQAGHRVLISHCGIWLVLLSKIVVPSMAIHRFSLRGGPISLHS
jgi:hypothetical protein